MVLTVADPARRVVIGKIAPPKSEIPVVVHETNARVERLGNRQPEELHIVEVLLADAAPVGSRDPLPPSVTDRRPITGAERILQIGLDRKSVV